MGVLRRAMDLLLRPRQTWTAISTEETTARDLYLGYAVPLALIPAITAFIGLTFVGFPVAGVTHRIPLRPAFTYTFLQFGLSLAGLYLVALFTSMTALLFASRPDRLSALKLILYSNTPSWIAGILLAIPVLAPVAMGLSIYSLYLLYIGIPVLMGTPRGKRILHFIYIIVITVVVFLAAGAAANLFLAGHNLAPLV
jgi:hypothetical protein